MLSKLDPAMIRFFEKEISNRIRENERIKKAGNIERHPALDSIFFNPFQELKKYDICFSINETIVLASVGEYISKDNNSAILWKSALTHMDMEFLEGRELIRENTRERLIFSIFEHLDNGGRRLQDMVVLHSSAIFPIIAAAIKRAPLNIDYCYDPDFVKKRKPKASEEKLGFIPMYVIERIFRHSSDSKKRN